MNGEKQKPLPDLQQPVRKRMDIGRALASLELLLGSILVPLGAFHGNEWLKKLVQGKGWA